MPGMIGRLPAVFLGLPPDLDAGRDPAKGVGDRMRTGEGKMKKSVNRGQLARGRGIVGPPKRPMGQVDPARWSGRVAFERQAHRRPAGNRDQDTGPGLFPRLGRQLQGRLALEDKINLDRRDRLLNQPAMDQRRGEIERRIGHHPPPVGQGMLPIQRIARPEMELAGTEFGRERLAQMRHPRRITLNGMDRRAGSEHPTGQRPESGPDLDHGVVRRNPRLAQNPGRSRWFEIVLLGRLHGGVIGRARPLVKPMPKNTV